MKYTDQDLLSKVKTLYETDGVSPSSLDKRLPHKNIYRCRFGRWGDVLQLAGVPPRTKEKIINECGFCGEQVTSSTQRNKQFCNTTCSNKSRRGENYNQSDRMPRGMWLAQQKQSSHDNMMNAKFEDLSWDLMRRRVLFEQQDVCNKCGISEWMGVPLSLDVDHIDGNRDNNNRTNLEALCPNCHSITDTYKGRNKRSMRDRHSTTDKIEAYKSTENIHQALLLLGMAPKGANYANMKKVLQEANLLTT
jgi:hypothetical protein